MIRPTVKFTGQICPVCNAGIGRPCTAGGKAISQSHKERYRSECGAWIHTYDQKYRVAPDGRRFEVRSETKAAA